MNLTNQQNLAANHMDGPILVLAGPGAGKTTMLLHRISNLSKIIDPVHILTITFSKNQAIDMEERYDGKETNFMTIHAFCYLIIRNYLKKNNRSLRLLETDDLYSKYDLIRNIYYRLNNKKITNEDLKEFFKDISYMKNAMLNENYLKNSKVKECVKIYRAYENFKIKNFYIDFDDMQVIALKLIENDKSLLNSIRNKYRYIQVDEGQDTSLIQFKIIEKIAAPNNNLMIVADDDQSIYSFRASDISYLLNFKNIYPESKTIILNENHRSGKNIVDISSRFIDKNNFRYKKDLYTNNTFDSNITIKSFKNVYDQYKFIIKNITLDDKCAILFRNNIQALNMISFFMDDGIDFNLKISDPYFLESKIIEDFFDIIEFSNDFSKTEIFKEVYYKIGTFLSKDDIVKLEFKPINQNIFDFYYSSEIDDYKIDALIKTEKELKHIRNLILSKKISFIYKYLGYKSYISNFSKRYKEEVVNKDLFVESFINFTKDLNDKKEFEDKVNKLNRYINSNKSNIILSSIHKSKGLEYDKVFLINLNENEFPMIGDGDDYNKNLEEERRVMYVAMTRAKKELFLLSIKKRSGINLNPSIFVNEVKSLK
ncbi:ATP-dependent helicase [Anaerococcus prevotii]|uniref:DNA 3'-5' helicase n=1 Tax=Anaerococcus prevotii ACS-065-V-Col13 TaxID=879305 RepID=F0GUM7_9FIRM|nr:ATP-dependent helicase [Anaerococcus prevotii]EGC82330.1 UvrD/REP helicase [Anaerococcus prevotii ACS-065-V-Col13]